MTKREKIRNIAIVAHIDHGKTTLLDALLMQGHLFRDNEKLEERMMDSFDQEKERGITIFAKHTSILWNDYKINIIDTPGHADFSHEVERILGMVSSTLVLVDAQEGPMPQTRFVLSKSLQMGLKPIVVVNKIDRPHANPYRALDLTFDLFSELGATDEQLDFAHCYASGLSRFAVTELHDPHVDMTPMLNMIIDKVPPPDGDENKPFAMQVSTLFYDDYVGRQACGRVRNGSLKKQDKIIHTGPDGKDTRVTITRIEGHMGLKKIELDEAVCGDIVILTGVPEVMIGDVLAADGSTEKMTPIAIAEPTVAVDISINSSPLSGRSGKYVTANKLKERLTREKRSNISLKIDFDTIGTDVVTVQGRGELHLSVLIETLRREGYELSISTPRVIFKEENGVTTEPYERTSVEVPEEFAGIVIEELSRRKGELTKLSTTEHKTTHLEFLIPTRCLMGYRNDFLTITKGLGILTSQFDSYGPFKGKIITRREGVMIASCSGKSTPYALFQLQERGFLFVGPGEDIYEGMIVGEHSRDNDLVVNATKEKHLTNVRAAGCDENIILVPAREFTLEKAITYIQDDELVEVTPDAIRLRKRSLKEIDRKRDSR